VVGFLLRLAISAFGLWVAAKIVPGMAFDGTGTLVVAAFLLGFANAFVRPLLILLTLPLTVLTLGLFLFVVNGLVLMFVAWLLPGFEVQGLFAAILGAIVSGLVSGFASGMIGANGRVEVITAESIRI
jgi:putative membrane protein